MQANDRDSVSLWDMAQAIRRIQEFTADVSCETYLETVVLYYTKSGFIISEK